MSDELNYCVDGGYVVGNEDIPGDVSVYRRAGGERVACNRLWCGSCGVLVKYFSGLMLTGGGRDGGVDHAKLYDSENPEDWEPFVTRRENFRTYFCKCAFVTIYGMQQASYLDSKNIDNWRCGGHPRS